MKVHRAQLIALAAIAALLVTFGVLASEVIEVETLAFDKAILLALRNADGSPIGPNWVSVSIIHLSSLGSVAVGVLVVVISSAFLFLDRKPRQALLVIGCTVLVAIVIEVLKAYVARMRPTVVHPIDFADGMSFPSGHTLLASVLYPMIAFVAATNLKRRSLRVFLIAIAVFIPLLVGFTRVYIGVHYPTDVIGGWCLGAAFAIACSLVVQTFQKRGVVEPAEPHTS